MPMVHSDEVIYMSLTLTHLPFSVDRYFLHNEGLNEGPFISFITQHTYRSVIILLKGLRF